MQSHEPYMHRCIGLARRGAGHVAPNPMVGAVLVHGDRIIGEGWHQYYGQAHAEVHCINDTVSNGYANRISSSTLYVSLEPCTHFGKTPPCSDLIIKHKIPKVVIGCRDPFKEVNGKGIEKLNAAGIETTIGILEDECHELNKRFFVFQKNKRPYIILKWAETADHKIGTGTGERLLISNDYTNRLVHKWRSEEAAILVGTNTALLDDPELSCRHWPGPSPVRLVIDMELKLPSRLRVFNRKSPTIIFNAIQHNIPDHSQLNLQAQQPHDIMYYQVTHDANLVHQVLNALYQMNIQSVLVEGGARTLQSFIDEGLWDEVRRIGNQFPVDTAVAKGKGINAPALKNHSEKKTFSISSDIIEIFSNQEAPLTY